MKCQGCGNHNARITKTYATDDGLIEYCDDKLCGSLKTPWIPDVHFPGPHFAENLGDAEHPNGIFIESKRQKARILQAQGLREDGDKVHGSTFRDARPKKREFPRQFKEKLERGIRNALRKR